jgi:hypothetical protein
MIVAHAFMNCVQKMVKFRLSSLSLISVAVLGSGLLAVGELGAIPVKSPARGTPTSTQDPFTDYKKKCIQQASQRGVPSDIAEKGCTCTIETFRKQYTIGTFSALVRQADGGDKKSKRTLASVGEACFDPLIFED